MSRSNLLATAVGILFREKRLLVCETSQGLLELPGFLVVEAQKVTAHLNGFLSQWGLSEVPQQTLYLCSVPLKRKRKMTVIGLVRVIRCSKKPRIELPNSRYERFELLIEGKHSTALTKAVAQWISQVV